MIRRATSVALRWTGAASSCLSLACAAHCLLLPLVIAVLPLAGLSFLLDSPTERYLVLGGVGLAAVNVCLGWRQHRQGRVWLVWLGAAALLTAGLMCADEALELLFMVGGALTLVAGNWFNHQLLRACPAGRVAADADRA